MVFHEAGVLSDIRPNSPPGVRDPPGGAKGGQHGVDGDHVPWQHFVEQTLGASHKAPLRVAGQQGGANDHVGGEVQLAGE
jgi:hypothetical protein